MFKKFGLCFGLCVITSLSYAAIPGYYAGLQFGQSDANIDSANTTLNSQAVVMNKRNKKGFGARAFVGYNVTKLYAMELGFVRFQTATWNTTVAGSAVRNTSLNTMGADLMSRFSWRFSRFSIFGSVGLSLLRGVFDSYNSSFRGTNYYIRPVGDIGASVGVTKNIRIIASYYRIFGTSDMNDALNHLSPGRYLPNLSLASIGFSYAF